MFQLLDEVPIGAKEAKRRRKMAEQDTVEQEKKDQEATSSTPDYAAGLIAPAAIVVSCYTSVTPVLHNIVQHQHLFSELDSLCSVHYH